MKLSTDRLRTELALARLTAPHGSEWQHKKGGIYIVTGHAFDTVTEKPVIVYQRTAGPGFNAEAEYNVAFSRPVNEWTPDRFTQLN